MSKRIETPVWNAFLHSIWPNDPANIKLLHEWLGYCLTNSTDLQKFMLFIGLSRAGKGVLTRMISLLLGHKNICSPTLQGLNTSSLLHKMSLSKHAFINDAHSVTFSMRDSVLSQFKAITGEDPITFHVMYKGARTIEPMPCRITMSTNGMPEFVDSSGALMNRALVLPFRETFAGNPDVNLYRKLSKEIEGIAQKAIQGYIRLRANNGVFTVSLDSESEKDDIKEDMFPLSNYVRNCCDLLEGAETSVDDLFVVYQFWCNTNGINSPMTKIQFSKQLRNSSLPINLHRPVVGGFKVRTYQGIKINKQISDTISNAKHGFSPVS